jgi:hypothetical protein
MGATPAPVRTTWLPAGLPPGNGLGVTTASVSFKAHLMASKYMVSIPNDGFSLER